MGSAASSGSGAKARRAPVAPQQQTPPPSASQPPGGRWALAVHGGAGVINSDNAEWIAATREGVEAALDAGAQVLAAGGSALDAVTAAVVALEDNPRFNAGRGSVLTRAGRHELEASIMTQDKACGAAALLTRVKNPILLARKVMEETPHVLLAGPPAEDFAAGQGLELVGSNEWFTTEQRRAQWEAWVQKQGCLAKHDDLIQGSSPAAGGSGIAAGGGTAGGAAGGDTAAADGSGGGSAAAAAGGGGGAAGGSDARAQCETVGAVAVDSQGRLAAATSTGGRCGKWDGRVGDTPIIGAGNWADTSVALSGTGVGEEFQRRAACHDVAARVAYGGASLSDAMRAVVFEDMAPGDGGFIGVSSNYDIAMEFNSQGMARGAADSDGRREVAIFKGE